MYEKRIKEKIKRFYIHLTKGADIVPEIVKGILEQKDIHIKRSGDSWNSRNIIKKYG